MVEKTPAQVLKMGTAERRGKRLRQFVAALGRYRPLLAVSLDQLAGEKATPDGALTVLVVSDGSFDWAMVDRLSDGVVQGLVYKQDELLAELARPDSVLFEAVGRGSLLLGSEEARQELLAGTRVGAEQSESVRA